MKYVIPMAAVAFATALAGCDRPATTSSTTVVKEPQVVQKESKETVVQREVPAPAPSTSTNVTIDTTKSDAPKTTETTKSTSRVDTPMGSATRTETTKTTQ